MDEFMDDLFRALVLDALVGVVALGATGLVLAAAWRVLRRRDDGTTGRRVWRRTISTRLHREKD